jgi:hypothetical protein
MIDQETAFEMLRSHSHRAVDRRRRTVVSHLLLLPQASPAAIDEADRLTSRVSRARLPR